MFDIREMILPSPHPSFVWRDTAAGPALVCGALAPLASHLFTTRPWMLGSSTPGEEGAWAEIAAAVGGTAVTRLRQVHGDHAVVARAPLHDLCEGDILVTDNPAVTVAVQAADCVPLLIADRKTRAVAAAHAGWRGMVARVPRALVATLVREFGSRPEDLVAAMGPSIGACCYEVGGEVRDRFVAADFSPEQVSRWFHATPMPTPTNRSMPLSDARPGHWYFDGWMSVREQLESEGIGAGRIYSAELCTASHPEVFCSYRRSGSRAGRIAGVITPLVPRP
jgi:YfiH family protein